MRYIWYSDGRYISSVGLNMSSVKLNASISHARCIDNRHPIISVHGRDYGVYGSIHDELLHDIIPVWNRFMWNKCFMMAHFIYWAYV